MQMHLVKMINQKPYGEVIRQLAIPIRFEINIYTEYIYINVHW